MGDRIVFVRVAPRTTHRQTHEGGGCGFDAVDDILDLILVGNRPAFEIDHVVAVEAGGHLLLARGIRQQVAGQLLDGELIEWQVAVERVDDPVSPWPHPAQAVDVVAVCIRVACGIQPRHGHTLTVTRRLQQRVDATFVSVGRAIGEKAVDLCRRGRQAGEVVGHAPQQRHLVRLG